MIEAIPMNGQTWLICGGRDFEDLSMFWSVMSSLMWTLGCPSKIVHGGAKGADKLAAAWAEAQAIEAVSVPAEWRKRGRSAGVIRNQQMLEDHRPQVVVAFPGGRGTADMVARAKAKAPEVTLIEVKLRPQEAVRPQETA